MSEHLSAQSLEQYRQRALSPEEVLRADDHLAACEVCRARAVEGGRPEELLRTFDVNLRAGVLGAEPEHLSYEQIAALVDNGLDRADREIAESHLEFCQLCTDEVDDLRVYRASLLEAPAGNESRATAAAPSIGILAAFRRLFAFPPPLRLAAALTLLLVSLIAVLWWRQTRPSPEVAQTPPSVPEETPRPSPTPEGPPASNEDTSIVVALEDAGGRVTLDAAGAIKGLESISPEAERAVKNALTTGRVPATDALVGLSGKPGALMSGSKDSHGTFSLLSPVGVVIRSDQPRFSWRPLPEASSYTVTILDSDLRIVATSLPVTTTVWTPPQALERGFIYSWQVSALKGDEKIIAPAANLPESRFRVLSKETNDRLGTLERTRVRSHLALGVLYAQAGLLNEAERELRALLAANPRSEVARKLLRSLRK